MIKSIKDAAYTLQLRCSVFLDEILGQIVWAIPVCLVLFVCCTLFLSKLADVASGPVAHPAPSSCSMLSSLSDLAVPLRPIDLQAGRLRTAAR